MPIRATCRDLLKVAAEASKDGEEETYPVAPPPSRALPGAPDHASDHP